MIVRTYPEIEVLDAGFEYIPKLCVMDKHGYIIEGYYAEMPETTFCFTTDYISHPVKTRRFLIGHRMTDWGLPNELTAHELEDNDEIWVIPNNEKEYHTLIKILVDQYKKEKENGNND